MSIHISFTIWHSAYVKTDLCRYELMTLYTCRWARHRTILLIVLQPCSEYLSWRMDALKTAITISFTLGTAHN